MLWFKWKHPESPSFNPKPAKDTDSTSSLIWLSLKNIESDIEEIRKNQDEHIAWINKLLSKRLSKKIGKKRRK